MTATTTTTTNSHDPLTTAERALDAARDAEPAIRAELLASARTAIEAVRARLHRCEVRATAMAGGSPRTHDVARAEEPDEPPPRRPTSRWGAR